MYQMKKKSIVAGVMAVLLVVNTLFSPSVAFAPRISQRMAGP